ncbi:MAG: transcriptional regulator [Bacteroidetes bacterium GWF2_38_335]|nr:MAG: transcriptional regulator [Bacteroidetes bacterium GWF2_38_335]OFY76980.1 MAG: transcriptional regulator [Bacteroidetes bacterium RIFOXYA12_FULL_38_20]HBS86835.1 transcriptional regulator [Bacteroidales bacterium]
MKEIRMVDLAGQYEKIKQEIDSAIQGVINATSFVKGPEVALFEKELAAWNNSKHCISCANGTDALQIALMALDLKPGDEVITADFTFIATVEAIALLGLTPVLADVIPGTFNIDPESVKKAITPKTKAIIPVHLFGQSADMDSILEIAAKNNLFIIEDLAQAIGTEYTFKDSSVKKTGTIGHIGCTSFFPSKNLGCFGDGGAIFTNDDTLAAKLRSVVNHGMTVRYYHDHVGVNSRLDGIQAALLSVKLKYLNNYISDRQRAAAFYDEKFKNIGGLIIPERTSNSTHTFHQYTLRIAPEKRDAMIEHLKKHGVPAMVYYPVPLHLQKAYQSARYKEGDFPVTEKLCKSVFSLPMHTELDEEQLTFITDTVITAIRSL